MSGTYFGRASKRGVRFGRGVLFGGSSGVVVPTAPTDIVLSDMVFDEDTPLGPIATIAANGSPASGFTIANDPDGLFSIVGNVLNLVAPFDYEASTSHTLEIEANNGIGVPHLKEFTITVNDVDDVGPALVSFTPTGIEANLTDPIVLTFDEPIQEGTGNVILRHEPSGWEDFEVFTLPDDIGSGPGTVEISGNSLIITPTNGRSYGRRYAVRMWTTAIDDTNGNSFAGIANDTTVQFTTQDAPAVAPSDIDLSVTSVPENALPGSVVAVISSDGTAPVTFSEVLDPDGKFRVEGSNLVLDAALDYETNTSHSVRLRASNTAGSHEQTFVINVTDVAEGGISDQVAFFPASAAAGTTRFKPFDSNGDEVDITTIVNPGTGSLNPSISADNGLVFDGLPSADNGREIEVGTPLGNVRLTLDSTTPGEGYANVGEALALMVTDVSGRAFFGRPGTYAFVTNNSFNGKFNDLTAICTWDACSPEAGRKPVWDTAAVFSGGAPVSHLGDVTWNNTDFHRDIGIGTKLAVLDMSQAGLVILEETQMPPRNVSFIGCKFSSNAPIARLTGNRPSQFIIGVWCKSGQDVTIINCEAEYMASLAIIDQCDGFTLDGNVEHHCWGDMFNVTGGSSNGTITNNKFHDWIGDHGIHIDFVHMFPGTVPAADIADILFEGNVAWPGVEGLLSPAWPTSVDGGAYVRDASHVTGSFSLSAANHEKFISLDPTTTQTVTLTDPSAAPGARDVLLQRYVDPIAVTTIDANGFTLWDHNRQIAITSWDMIQPNETIQLRIDPVLNRWTLHRYSGAMQPIFTNGNTFAAGFGYKRIRGSHNIMWGHNAGNLFRFDGADTDDITDVRSFYGSPWGGDLDNSGRPNSIGNGGPHVVGSAQTQGTNMVITDCFVGAVSVNNVEQNGPPVDVSNTKSEEVDMTVWGDVVDNFNVDDPGVEVHNPTSLLEAIAKARPKIGSVYATNGDGPLGAALDGSGDLYNYGQLPGDIGLVGGGSGGGGDLAYVDLRPATFLNSGQRATESITTTVAASGNHPVRAILAIRHAGTGSNNQTYTATIDGDPIDPANVRVQDGNHTLTCVTIDIPSSQVPADIFTLAVTRGVDLFNGISGKIAEMVNAADDQSTALVSGSSHGDVTPRTLSITPLTDGHGATGVSCIFSEGVSVTGTPAPAVLDDNANAGNGVTYGQFAVTVQPTAGPISMSFEQTEDVAANTQLIVEVIKA